MGQRSAGPRPWPDARCGVRSSDRVEVRVEPSSARCLSRSRSEAPILKFPVLKIPALTIPDPCLSSPVVHAITEAMGEADATACGIAGPGGEHRRAHRGGPGLSGVTVSDDGKGFDADAVLLKGSVSSPVIGRRDGAGSTAAGQAAQRHRPGYHGAGRLERLMTSMLRQRYLLDPGRHGLIDAMGLRTYRSRCRSCSSWSCVIIAAVDPTPVNCGIYVPGLMLATIGSRLPRGHRVTRSRPGCARRGLGP